MAHLVVVLDFKMICLNPIRITKNLEIQYPDGLEVPCGKCLNCRIQRRKEWQIRLLHELKYWDKSMFLTLTYNDENVPKNNSLLKTDLQKFFKRVRKNMTSPLKYYACGEYGEETQRPHYHAIIFGLGLKEPDKQIIRDAWYYCDWSNKSINKNSFGLVEPFSIQYVTGYIHDKLSGEEAEKEYTQKNRESVFKIQSRGLGLRYCMDNKEQLIQQKKITIFGEQRALPRYYIKKLGLSETELLTIKEKAIENDRKTNKKLIGEKLTSDDVYRTLNTKNVIKWNENVKKSRKQHDKNLRAKINLKKKSL